MHLLFMIKWATVALTTVVSLIGIHHAFEGWKRGLVSVAIVKQQEQMYAQEIAIRDKQVHILSEANATFKQEVEWARDHVQKQNEKIESLTEQASLQVQECLGLSIDGDFVR